MSRDMKATDYVRYLKLLLALIAVSTLFGVLIPAVRTSGIAQSKEREFEDKIPKHLPIKIKIQPEKEKAAKDLNNRRWHHDLALEVKNIGDRPVYYLSFFLDMPEIKPNGIIVAAHLYYGQRSIFGEWKGMAQPQDVPLRPHETIVLTLGKLQADGWDERRKIENLPQPNKISIVFQELNFGDGTGFVGGTGAPWPIPKRASAPAESQSTVPASLSGRRLHHVEANNIAESRLNELIGGESARIWPTSFRSVTILNSYSSMLDKAPPDCSCPEGCSYNHV